MARSSAPSASIFSSTSYMPGTVLGPAMDQTDRPLPSWSTRSGGWSCLQTCNTPPVSAAAVPAPAGPAPPGKPFSHFRSWPQVSRWSQEQCKEGLGHLNITAPGSPHPQTQTETLGSEKHSGQGAESHCRGSHFISSFRFQSGS